MATCKWLVPSEIAAEMGLSDQCVRNWIHLGLLKGYRWAPNGPIRVKREDLDKFIAAGEIKGNPRVKELINE